MGDIIGGAVGGIGSLIAGNRQSEAIEDASRRAAETARLGFDFAQDNPLFAQLGQQGGQAASQIGGLLGIGGQPAQSQAFDNFFANVFQPGLDFELEQGSRAITNNRAARGLLDSGATARGLQEFGQGLGNTRRSNALAQFLGNATNLANLGLTSQQTIANAASGAGSTGAQIQQQAGQDLAGIRGNALGGIVGGLSQVGTGIENRFFSE